jgi:hypothetical protein
MSQTVGANPALAPCSEIVNYVTDAGDLEADSSAHREAPRPNTRGPLRRVKVAACTCEVPSLFANRVRSNDWR